MIQTTNQPTNFNKLQPKLHSASMCMYMGAKMLDEMRPHNPSNLKQLMVHLEKLVCHISYVIYQMSNVMM